MSIQLFLLTVASTEVGSSAVRKGQMRVTAEYSRRKWTLCDERQQEVKHPLSVLLVCLRVRVRVRMCVRTGWVIDQVRPKRRVDPAGASK